MRYVSLALLLLLLTIAPAAAKKPAPLRVADLIGCYEAPPGDDNFNLMRFDGAGRFFYLDTSIGKPVQYRYRLQGRELTILYGQGGDRPQHITAIDQDGIRFAAGDVWKRIACQRFTDHIRR
ncbi:MAG TPA: hypothetical protein VL172_16385 [Kofleriaceae bacterium]|nr:hypothetical protein [Kofleriaceae bacterium]